MCLVQGAKTKHHKHMRKYNALLLHSNSLTIYAIRKKKEQEFSIHEKLPYLYMGQNTDMGRSQPGASAGNEDANLEKYGHLRFSWHRFIKFHSAGTISVRYASTVIIRSRGNVLNVTWRKAQIDPTASTSASDGAERSEWSVLNLTLKSAFTYALHNLWSNWIREYGAQWLIRPRTSAVV